MLSLFEETVLQASSFWKAKSIPALKRPGEPPTTNTRVLLTDGSSSPTEWLACRRGNYRENEIGVNVLRIQVERPSSTRFQETQLLRLACAHFENRRNQDPCFDMKDLNAALLSYTLRKVQVPVLSATNIGVPFTQRFSKPLPNQARGRDIRLISLIETAVKLIDTMFLQNWGSAQAHTFQFFQSNMEIGQESQLETKWLESAWCQAHQNSRRSYFSGLERRVWECQLRESLTISKFQRSPVWMDAILEARNDEQTCQGCFAKQSRFSLASRLPRLSTRPPILLHTLCVVLGWMSKGNQQAVRPKLLFRGW